MQDVKVQRGADAASDHHLVLARMKMMLRMRDVKKSTSIQHNVDFLKDGDNRDLPTYNGKQIRSLTRSS